MSAHIAVIILIICFIIFICYHKSRINPKTHIICFLSVRPSPLFYDFCKKLKNEKYDIYIVQDDNLYNIPDYDGEINIIKIKNEICERNGFKSSVLWLDNKACARDKSLYYFCRIKKDYDYIWFLEDDVFVPSIHTIQNIDNKYIDSDLLVSAHDIVREYHNDWHWNHINRQIKIKPPYASAMICAIRCSKKLLNYIDDYATKYNNLFMDEALFNTISLHNNLEVKVIPELESIVYRRDWKKEDIKETNLYHPIKSIETQYEYRK